MWSEFIKNFVIVYFFKSFPIFVAFINNDFSTEDQDGIASNNIQTNLSISLKGSGSVNAYRFCKSF